MDVKRIVIFGGTGMSGQCAVDSAIKLGLDVTLLVRDSTSILPEQQYSVTAVQGDVLDASVVARAVQGQDACVVVLGTRNDLGPTTMMSEGLQNILAAMNSHGVSMLSVCVSSFMFRALPDVPAMMHNVHADHTRMFEMLQACGMQWVAVAPPHITKAGPENEDDYQTSVGSAPPVKTVTKQRLGHFLVTCLRDQSNYGQLVGVCDPQ